MRPRLLWIYGGRCSQDDFGGVGGVKLSDMLMVRIAGRVISDVG